MIYQYNARSGKLSKTGKGGLADVEISIGMYGVPMDISRMSVLGLYCKTCVVGVALAMLGDWIIMRVLMRNRSSL